MQPQTPPTKFVFSCSGAADVGEIADRAARQLQRQGVAKMYCLAGIGGRVQEIMERTRAAEKFVVIDGCEKECGKNCFQQAGFESFGHVRVKDLGMEKGKSPVNEERINTVASRAAGDLM